MRKDTRPSPALPYSKRRKAGRGLGDYVPTARTCFVLTGRYGWLIACAYHIWYECTSTKLPVHMQLL